jgi:hypothetical protein
MRRRGDLVFAVFFALFFCGWLAFDLPVALGLVNKSAGWYAQNVDPLFQHTPLWLDVVGWFAAFYGPIYLALAYGIVRGKSWVPLVVLPFAGLITATNVIYWVVELKGDVRPKNMALFALLNVPYLVIPPLAAVRYFVTLQSARGENSLATTPSFT